MLSHPPSRWLLSRFENGGAENRTRVQRPTPSESTCLDASLLPVSLGRVRFRRVSETSKTPSEASPDFSRPPPLSTSGRPAQLCDISLRALERLAAKRLRQPKVN